MNQVKTSIFVVLSFVGVFSYANSCVELLKAHQRQSSEAKFDTIEADRILSSKDDFQVFGLTEDKFKSMNKRERESALKKKFRELLKAFHPDVFVNTEYHDMATQTLKRVNVAHDKLSVYRSYEEDILEVFRRLEDGKISIENASKAFESIMINILEDYKDVALFRLMSDMVWSRVQTHLEKNGYSQDPQKKIENIFLALSYYAKNTKILPYKTTQNLALMTYGHAYFNLRKPIRGRVLPKLEADLDDILYYYIFEGWAYRLDWHKIFLGANFPDHSSQYEKMRREFVRDAKNLFSHPIVGIFGGAAIGNGIFYIAIYLF